MNKSGLQRVYAREALCEEAFTTWVHDHGFEGVLDALGEILSWLDGIASCRWGSRAGDHQEEHLLGRASASACAALLLLSRGYFDQAAGVVRELAETHSLLELFTHSSRDHQGWLGSGEEIRRNRYSAFNVRNKLVSLGVTPIMEQPEYQMLSRYGSHPGSGTEPRPHDSVGAPTVGTPYRPAVSFLFTIFVSNLVIRAVLYGGDLLSQQDVKRNLASVVQAAMKENDGVDISVLKQEADLVLQPTGYSTSEEI